MHSGAHTTLNQRKNSFSSQFVSQRSISTGHSLHTQYGQGSSPSQKKARSGPMMLARFLGLPAACRLCSVCVWHNGSIQVSSHCQKVPGHHGMRSFWKSWPDPPSPQSCSPTSMVAFFFFFFPFAALRAHKNHASLLAALHDSLAQSLQGPRETVRKLLEKGGGH